MLRTHGLAAAEAGSSPRRSVLCRVTGGKCVEACVLHHETSCFSSRLIDRGLVFSDH